MKDSYYFPHDSNAHIDPKIIDLFMDLKAEGYGVYWVILEMMRNEQLHRLCISNCIAIAYQSHSTLEVVEKVVKNYGLFVVDDDGYFWSESLKKRMEHFDAKRSILSTNAKKRWSQCKSNANAMQLLSSKGKGKVKVKVNISEKFEPPLMTAVDAYCKERRNGVDVNKWFNFYESKGWMIGKNKMKDWKACVRTWENNSIPEKTVREL